MNWKLWPAIALLAAGLGCSNDKAATPATIETVRDVSVVVAQRASVPEYVEAVGTVRAAQQSQLASQMMGTLVRVDVHEGDRVRRGQVLAVVDDAQPRAGLERANAAVTASEKDIAAAESDFRLAGATLQRYQGLYERKSISPQEFDEVKARYAAADARRQAAHAGQAGAQAAMAQARTSLEYARIRAPFDGVVTAKLAEAGSVVAPGTPVFAVENPSQYRLEANVDESDIGAVRLGEPVSIVVDALGGREIAGKVSQIVPAADPASRTFLVKIELPAAADLRSGLFGRARFRRGMRDAITVPSAAIVQRGQLQGLYVVGTDQVANLRFITIGKQAATGSEVLAGLEPGDRFVANPGGRDLATRKIEVR